VLGIGMCLGYLLWAKLADSLPEESFALLLGVFPLLIGLGLIAVVSKNVSQAKKLQIENFYAFSEESVLVRTQTKGVEGTAYSYPYGHFKKIVHAPHYLFLYPQTGAAFGVDKRKLTADELSTLLGWLKKYIKK
jgi:hypothetical protein